MRRTRLTLSVVMSLLVVSTTLTPIAAVAAQEDEGGGLDEPRVLVFSATEGFRHDSIPDGIAAIEQLGARDGFAVDATEDAGEFTEANLAQYDAVVWLSTTGSVLDAEQQAAFESYIEGGGGYAGIHAAADTHYDWDWYGGLVGAYFQSHPSNQTAEIMVTDRVHPSTEHLPAVWERFDEWYNYQSNPRGDVHVLMSLDETSYDAGDGAMGHDHPIAWCHSYEGGRSWYTGGGHTTESFSEDAFVDHLAGGIKYAAGIVPGDCGGTVEDSFDKVLLAEDIGEPMHMKVAPDGRVFLTARSGELRIWDPETESTVLAGTVPVFDGLEDGLIGVALDPDFGDNNWIYLHYSHPTESRNQVSRFTMNGNSLNLASEVVLLHWWTQREVCCHAAGALDFDADGNLLIVTGDNTNSMASNGYTPIDEREGRHAYDAQDSSGDTADLRGKLLRITPLDDPGTEPGVGSTYTVPDDNLFTSGEWDGLFPDGQYDPELGAPEIYVMGLRNPFRMHADHETDTVVLGMVGADADNDSDLYGPRAYDTLHRIEEAGNVGWPYCATPWLPYRDRDFETGEVGDYFDCDDLVNDSPNNKGLEQLPPAEQAPTVWYHRGFNPDFPEIDDGHALWVVGGPIYRYDESIEDPEAFPEYFDGQWFWGEGGRNFTKTVHLDDDGEYLRMDPFLPGESWNTPHSYDFGPDGKLYVVEYGSGWFGPAADNGLYRIDYTGGEAAPVARASADVTTGDVPLDVQFTGEESFHPDGLDFDFAWDLDGDGGIDSTDPNPTWTYAEPGNYNAQLVVTDTVGRTGTANVGISAGNTAPHVTIDWPPDGAIAALDDEVDFEVVVTDAEDGSTEDGTIDCEMVTVQTALGHDDHGHPGPQQSGCDGRLQSFMEAGHSPFDDLFTVVSASYTDQGGYDGAVDPITTTEQHMLQPRRKQAHYTTDRDGVATVSSHGGGAGVRLGQIEHGDWVSYDPVNLVNIHSMSFRVSSAGAGGDIEIRQGSPDGELLGTVAVEPTGNWNDYDIVHTEVQDPGESFELFLVFSNPEAADEQLLGVDWLQFHGDGAADPESGFETIFDGTSLDGWEMAGPGGFELTDEGTMQAFGGMGLLWYTPGFYEDVTVRLDWRVHREDDNSGVFVRFPDPGDDPWVAVEQGHEIQILDGGTDPWKTGAVYNQQHPTHVPTNDVGEWNQMEITLTGLTYVITVNGEVVNTYSDQLDRGLDGYIGLQNHDDLSEVEFRDIRVRELDPDLYPDPEPDPDDTDPGPVLNTIGITDEDHWDNSGINGPYSWAAELMPPANEVVIPADDEFDDVPLLMPDTSGAQENVATADGQTYTLPASDQAHYDTVHFFGATTDAADGDSTVTYTINFTDGSSEEHDVRLADWGYPGEETPEHHVAIGPMEYRHQPGGVEYAPVPFFIMHAVVPLDDPGAVESVSFGDGPPGVTEQQILALTFENDGDYVTPDLGYDADAEPEPHGLFNIVGLTDVDHRHWGAIPGNFSYPAELLPPANEIVVPEDDGFDDVPLRMPDTSGARANLVQAEGQVYELTDPGQYSRVHLFGATTDGEAERQEGTYTFEFADGSTEERVVGFDDWAFPTDQTEDNHIAIGPIDYRHTHTGTQGQDGGVDFYFYHAVVDVEGDDELVAIHLPDDVPQVSPNQPTYHQILAMTFEESDGQFVTPDLAEGVTEPDPDPDPDPDEPPTVAVDLDPAEPDGEDGWYVSPVTVSLAVADDGSAPGAAGLFNTVGVTSVAHADQGQIPGDVSYAAELMPDSGEIVTPGDDDVDDVPLRMPDTSGQTPNMVTADGQTYELTDPGEYSTVHLFGATTDGESEYRTGSYVFEFADGSTEEHTVGFDDWGFPTEQTEHDHIAIGPMEYRHSHAGPAEAPVPFHIYHTVVDLDAAAELVAITLPDDVPQVSAHQPTHHQILAMTFETSDGDFVTPDLSLGPDPEPDGLIEYRIGGSDWLEYAEPFILDDDGTHTVEYRASNDAGTSDPASVEVRIDRTPPVTEATADGDQDGEVYVGDVTVTLDATDETSGVAETHYRMAGDEEFAVYEDPFTLEGDGDHTVEFRSVDAAGNLEDWQSLRVTIDTSDPEPEQPTTREDCADGGWQRYTDPEFRNEGRCVAWVRSGGANGPGIPGGPPGRR